MSLPDRVSIVEVGPRDGLQNEPRTLPVQDRIELIEMLVGCGLQTIEAGSFVRSDRIPQMADTGKVLAGLSKHPGARFPVLVPNARGLDLARAAGAQDIAIFAAASETFSQNNINCSIDQSMQRFCEVTKNAKQDGIAVRGYLSCVMGCPYEGDIDPAKVADLADQLVDMGCYEISLGDTIGVGTAKQTRTLIEAVAKKIDMAKMAVHFHDTYGQAIANIHTALQLGVITIDSAVAGLGGCPYARGASGNVATEDVVYLLNGLDIDHGIDLNKLVLTGQFISHKLGRQVVSRVNLALAARHTDTGKQT